MTGDGNSVPASLIVGAMAITILDGFDAFSLSLMAPLISHELSFSAGSLGPIFAIAMGGMIVGAATGGALADRVGRLPILLVSFAFFGLAAATMPLVTDLTAILFNRFVAGVGLGAAAPLAVSLMNRGERQPSEFAISLVWSGIPLGGGLGALFNYLVVTDHGWRSIFWVGAALPVPIAVMAWLIFRTNAHSDTASRLGVRLKPSALFAEGQAALSLATAGMFFFGYVTTSIVVNWLPTVLADRHASAGMVSLAFGAMTVGGVVGTLLLGWLAVLKKKIGVRTWAWGVASICGLAASIGVFGTALIAVLAVSAATMGAGAQALSVAFANESQRGTRLQSTSIGLMTGVGRLGQFSALGLSGFVVAISSDTTLVFALAAIAAGLATVFSIGASRYLGRTLTSKDSEEATRN